MYIFREGSLSGLLCARRLLILELFQSGTRINLYENLCSHVEFNYRCNVIKFQPKFVTASQIYCSLILANFTDLHSCLRNPTHVEKESLVRGKVSSNFILPFWSERQMGGCAL